MSNISTTIEDHIAEVRFNRPEKMNAITGQMFQDLSDTIVRLETEKTVRCVVLSGEGKSFCAGIDLETLAGDSTINDLVTRTHGISNMLQHAAFGWRELGCPVIAAVHGYVFGAGFQVALGADIRVAAPDTQLSFMEARWGIIPDLGGMALIRNLIREDFAREIVFTGRKVQAEEAQRFGVVTHISDDPREHAMSLARSIAGLSPQSVRAAKRVLNKSSDATNAEILMAESEEQTVLMTSSGHKESLLAHMQKRVPQYED
ncbi:MAG: crotonase/enoyl-CoA hydratase family protein [Pseudomonadota bacterium]